VFTDRSTNWKRDLLWGLASSTAYTILVAGLVYFGVLNLPSFLAVNSP
jgi:hypothetical protein